MKSENLFNVYQLKKKMTFRPPRSWDIHIRYAIAFRGKDVRLEPGSWLLEKGEVEYQLSDGPEKEYLYRLATGKMVALDRPLPAEDADPVTDPQIIATMNAFRTLEEAAVEDWNIHIEHINHLPPFGLIKCPLCGHTDFSSVDFAGVWCNYCNARFDEVGYTAGDPGFVVDCSWNHVFWGVARYLIPKSNNLGMRMVFKNAADPREMSHPDADRQWYQDNRDCTPENPRVTGEESRSLRPGLHRCHLGDVYDWRLDGRVPSRNEILAEKNLRAWEVDGVMWPGSAYITVSSLTGSEESTLRSLSSVLDEFKDDDIFFPNGLGRQEVVDILDDMVARQRKTGPGLGRFDLPLLSDLAEDERYLLHHWLTVRDDEFNFESAYPVWYVVQPVLGEEEFGRRPINGWTIVRRDICPCCGERVMPDVYDKLLKSSHPSYETPHWNCLKAWQQMEWTLQSAETETGTGEAS